MKQNTMQEIALSKHITVGPQPDAVIFERLASQGFATIINLTKKGELHQILSPEDAEKIAEENGMAYHSFPVSLSNLKDNKIHDFCSLVQGSEKPVYIHCRIGQRS